MSQRKLRRQFGEPVESAQIGRPEDMAASAYVHRNARGDVLYRGRVHPRPTGSPVDGHYSYLSVAIDSTVAAIVLVAVLAVVGLPVPPPLLWGVWLGLAVLHARRIHHNRYGYASASAALEPPNKITAGPEVPRLPSAEAERRTQVRVAAEAGLPHLDYESGEIWPPERAREWLAEQERLDGLRDKLALAEEDLSRALSNRRHASARHYREQVVRLSAELNGSSEPPVIPGEVHPSEEVWVDDEPAQEVAPPDVIEIHQDGEPEPVRFEPGRAPVRRPRGGKLARLSDGRTVGLTPEDLTMIRALGGAYVGRTITLPSGVRLIGEDVAGLAAELARVSPVSRSAHEVRFPAPRPAGPSVHHVRPLQKVEEPRLSAVVRADLATLERDLKRGQLTREAARSLRAELEAEIRAAEEREAQ